LLWLAAAAVAGQPPLPDFGRLEKAVNEHFASQGELPAGAVISRDDVAGLFEDQELWGWLSPERQTVIDRLLPADHFLVRELRTTAGRRFSARIADYPGGLDRLDRLARLPRGEHNVRVLVASRDGDQWIKYLTTDKRGLELSKSMSKAKNGRDFDKPTGRIYTAQMLVAALREIYQRIQSGADVKR
jgi:hypothetical protein